MNSAFGVATVSNGNSANEAETKAGRLTTSTMTHAEIEFELPAIQYELMNFSGLRQGQSLNLSLDSAVLLPDYGAENWFTVQPSMLAPNFTQVARATYAFSGQIIEADITDEDDVQSAVLLIDCGVVLLRVVCGPDDSGKLPYGTWETRYIAGLSRLYGTVEEEYASSVGRTTGVTLWGFHRLSLTPGDPYFGQWHESVELLPHPYMHDRIVISARIHNKSSSW